MNANAERVVHILCGAVSPPSRARFEAEAARLGRAVRWLDPHAIELTGDGLAHDGAPLALPEVALARSGGYTTDRALAILHAYEELGVTVVDSAEAVERCRDKIVAAGLLAAAGIPVPRTVAVEGAGAASCPEGATDSVGGMPVVVKPARGMKGDGVRLVHTAGELREALMLAQQPGLVQEYVPHEHDVRVIVVGGEALGGIRRVCDADFRSNLHIGGRAQAAAVTEDVAYLATTAAAALGAEVAGVDLLPRDGTHVVLEVNASPGFEGFEAATGVNVAGAIITHALSLV